MSQEISGSVESGALAKALSSVMRRKGGAILVASDGASFRQVEFGEDFMRSASVGPRPLRGVGDFLFESEALGTGELEGLRHFAHNDETKLEELAVKHGFVKEEQYVEALRARITEDVLDLFLWRTAEVRLLEQAPPDLGPDGPLVPGRLTTNVSRFIAKVLAQVEELHDNNGRVPSGREVFERTRLYAVDDDEPFAAMLRRLDGTCTFSRAIGLAKAPAVPAYRYVQQALKVGRLRRVSLRIARKVAHEDLLDEIDDLRKLLPQSAAPATVRLRLAHAYEVVGRPLRAATQWKHLGRYWEQRGAHDQALELYRNCVRLVPTDLATREAIVEVHRRRGDERGVITDGRPLAELFFKYNLPRRASVLLLKLVELEDHDIGLRRQLTTVLIGLGAKGLALRHLNELATLLEQSNAEPGELRDVYLQILALDHRSKRARQHLDSILGVATQRRAAWITVTGTAAVLVALWGWYGSEVVGRRSIRARVEEAVGYMETGEVSRARNMLQSTMERYGACSKIHVAERLRDQCDRLTREIEHRRLQVETPDVSESTRKAREAATALAEHAATQLAAGDEREGHETYLTLYDRYPWAPELERAELPLHVTVRPRDARIRLDGQIVGTGSATLTYTPALNSVLRIERGGFEPIEQTLDGPLDLDVALTLSPAVRWRWATSTRLDSSPVVADEGLLVAARDGSLKALSLTDGTERWSVALGLYSDAAARPVEAGGTIVVTTSEGTALGIDPAKQAVVWRRDLGSPAGGQPVRVGDRCVVVPSEDGSMTALDAPSGEQRWMLQRGTRTSGDPVAVEGGLAIVDQARSLSIASPEDGRLTTVPGRPVGLQGTPIVNSTHIWSLADGDSLRVLDVTDGRELARIDLTQPTRLPPAVHGESAFVVSNDGLLMGFDATGRSLFPARRLAAAPSAPPEYSRGRLYVSDVEGHLNVLDSRDGSLLWSFDAGERITSRPVFDYGTAYLVTERGSLIALAD